MTAPQYYLAEFDLEMGTTRRVLERVPGGKLTWKPHAKSSSLGQLASHVAQMPDWMAEIFKGNEFNFRPADGPAYAAADCKSSRSWGMNHVVHHRGQLTVYLRLLDVAVPSVYGPSADEPK